jgi:hypothetical protein
MRSKRQNEKSKQRVVTFKVEEDVAAFLDEMPNKSDFIRKALLSMLLEPCPVCKGKGSVPRSLRRDLELLFEKQQFVPCAFCGYEFPLGTERSRRGPTDRARLQQYLSGGEFYCIDCFTKTQLCEDCGEHVVQTRMVTHKKSHGRNGRIIRAALKPK